MPKIQDISGQTYGPIKVIKFDKLINNRSYWVCQCKCGNVRSIDKGNIKRFKRIQQNGCYCHRKDTKCSHAAAKTKEYYAWLHMRSRCYNENDKRFQNYGKRGIKVCDSWLKSFRNFLKDVGFAPTKKHSIDRINNDGDYEPSNCRWATKAEQMNNTSRSSYYTYLGKTQTLADWSREIGLHHSTILLRLKKGLTVEQAFSFPLNYRINYPRPRS